MLSSSVLAGGIVHVRVGRLFVDILGGVYISLLDWGSGVVVSEDDFRHFRLWYQRAAAWRLV